MHMAFLSRVFKNLQWYGMTKRNTSHRLVFLFGCLGNFKCSGEMNSPSAEVLPSAKHSHGALAPPARRPGGDRPVPLQRV